MAAVKKIKKAQPGTSVSAKSNARKKFVADSTSVAKNYNTWSNPKSAKKQRWGAEDALDEIIQRRGIKDFDKMGPAGKKLKAGLTDIDIAKKNGGKVTKRSAKKK
jgi:hypothetical protein